MSKRFFLTSVFAGAVLFPWCGPGLASPLCSDRSPVAVAQTLGIDLEQPLERSDDRPNVLIIIADDLGYADLGSYGGEIPTPNIDRIAEEGAKFTEGYVASAICSPSRAGLITGKSPYTFGYSRNLGDAGGAYGDVPTFPIPSLASTLSLYLAGPFRGGREFFKHFGLPLSEKTIADYFKERGYATGFVGKWHLGGTQSYTPKNRGFDEYYHFGGSYRRYSYHFRGGHFDSIQGRGRHDLSASILGYMKSCKSSELYRTDVEGLEATKFILQHRSQPFLLYFSALAPHWPMQSRKESLLTYLSYYRHLGYLRHAFDRERRQYWKMLMQFDQAVGSVLDTLDLLGLTENTVVWFFSDNGGNLGARADNGRLRGGKNTLYEGGIRVPFMLRWPRVVSPAVYEWPVSTLDVLPTSLAAAGYRSEDTSLSGVNLLPYLESSRLQPQPRDFYWRLQARSIVPKETRAVRSGDYKLVSHVGRTDKHKRDVYNELFNLKKDVGERTNLAEEKPEILRSLHEKLTAWTGALPEAKW